MNTWAELYIQYLMCGVFNCLKEFNYRQHLYLVDSILQVTRSCGFSKSSVALMDSKNRKVVDKINYSVV